MVLCACSGQVVHVCRYLGELRIHTRILFSRQRRENGGGLADWRAGGLAGWRAGRGVALAAGCWCPSTSMYPVLLVGYVS